MSRKGIYFSTHEDKLGNTTLGMNLQANPVNLYLTAYSQIQVTMILQVNMIEETG